MVFTLTLFVLEVQECARAQLRDEGRRKGA